MLDIGKGWPEALLLLVYQTARVKLRHRGAISLTCGVAEGDEVGDEEQREEDVRAAVGACVVAHHAFRLVVVACARTTRPILLRRRSQVECSRGPCLPPFTLLPTPTGVSLPPVQTILPPRVDCNCNLCKAAGFHV